MDLVQPDESLMSAFRVMTRKISIEQTFRRGSLPTPSNLLRAVRPSAPSGADG